MDGLAVGLRRRVDHLRSSDAARRRHVPFAGFDQIIVDKSENQIGLNPRAVAIHDAEAIRVAIRCQARRRFRIDYCFAQRREIFF